MVTALCRLILTEINRGWFVFTRSFIVTVFLIILSACANSTQKAPETDLSDIFIFDPVLDIESRIKDSTVGAWENIHTENPQLAGVVVQQFPDSLDGMFEHESKHPAMILFVMWSGAVNQIGYSPEGEIGEDFWWDINGSDRDYSYMWDQVDFSKGSDPLFERHDDPRKKQRTKQ